jgi:hypothetical protein
VLRDEYVAQLERLLKRVLKRSRDDADGAMEQARAIARLRCGA